MRAYEYLPGVLGHRARRGRSGVPRQWGAHQIHRGVAAQVKHLVVCEHVVGDAVLPQIRILDAPVTYLLRRVLDLLGRHLRGGPLGRHALVELRTRALHRLVQQVD